MDSSIGVIGIGIMGRNLAINLASREYIISTYDINTEQLKLLESYLHPNIQNYSDLTQFIFSLSKPKSLIILVRAGELVDLVISQVLPFLESGDIIIDGGNTHYLDTKRRYHELAAKGIRFIGLGISGGAEGARLGPSLMVGGDFSAWNNLKSLFINIAAKTVDGKSCVAWLGSEGAGHLVKTIHNGIEYADMEVLSEAYQILREIFLLDNPSISRQFHEWNSGKLESYLMSISSVIMNTQEGDIFLIDEILDKAGQKGTGRWTVEIGMEYGLSISIIASAVNQRVISSNKETRVHLSELYGLPQLNYNELTMKELEEAIYLVRILTLVQGFQVIDELSMNNGWKTQLSEVAQIWQAGCIIRSSLLVFFEHIFYENPSATKLLFNEKIISVVSTYWQSLQRVVSLGVAKNIPVPIFSASLQYLVSFQQESLPANLIQAQRDYFGYHGFQRKNQENNNSFHGDWS